MLTPLFLAMALQAGQPSEAERLSSLFEAEDYPIEALRNGEQGSVGYALRTGTDGRPKACAVTRSSGSKHLDRTTCSVLMERARFQPHRDSHGNPLEDVYTGEISWRFR